MSQSSGGPEFLAQKLDKYVAKRALGKFHKLGLYTVRDLLYHFPFRYVQWGDQSDIASLRIGENATISAQVRSSTYRPIQRGGYLFQATITDGKDDLSLVFFPRKKYLLEYYQRTMAVGAWGFFEGTVHAGRRPGDPLQLLHPSLVMVDPADPQSVAAGKELATSPQPVYHRCEGLKNATITKTIRTLLEMTAPTQLGEFLPAQVVSQLHLPSFWQALNQIHHPATLEDTQAAQRRFKFEEGFILQVALAQSRQRALSRPAPPCPLKGHLLEDFDAHLPFELTASQIEVGKEISQRLAQDSPMQVLLQGDVGSGKTLVATRAMIQVVENGKQAVLLAPTEVLARQHFDWLKQALAWEGKDVALQLLTGSAKAGARRQMLADAASGKPGIYVGTHALLSQQVQFLDLALVVVDEQHRFGVAQREKLRENLAWNPHLLVMTATPIPRTVAMTIFADLEVLELQGRPHQGANIETFIVYQGSKPAVERVWERAREEIAAGHRVFVVCPRIDENEPEDAALATAPSHPALSVAQVALELSRDPHFQGFQIATLHGRMDPAEKEGALARFRSGDAPLLVSTTVIEVGVDVPSAAMMVILDADRFGLSQLHQLRGRIGRDGTKSVCLALTWFGPDSVAGERLSAFAGSDDGFELAQVDFKLRREGDILGGAQSGRSRLKMLDIQRDQELIETARDLASALIAKDPYLESCEALAGEIGLRLDESSQQFLEKS